MPEASRPGLKNGSLAANEAATTGANEAPTTIATAATVATAGTTGEVTV